MLINLCSSLNEVHAQGGLDAPVNYEAKDSIIADVPKQLVKLYGEAIVTYEDIELNADYIEINLIKNEVMATYTEDSLGNPIGKPLFKAEGEESKCDYVRYNFKTKQGYIKEVRAQQDEGYIHMAEAKYHPNEQIHLKNGKFTTCENDTPHYHFKLTRAIIVPDKRIVTGPMYMKIFKVPTPLAAPFAFFPNTESKKHGIIIPSFTSAPGYGFGLQDFGYYIPLGDYWETQFNATIFTSGRFGIGNVTNYLKKYKYRGSVNLKFEQFRGHFYETEIQNKTTVRWTHTQDPKAHPSINFSGNINFQSDNNGKTSLDAQNPDYFNNQFNSAVSVAKRWQAGEFSGNASIKASLQQSSLQEQYTMNLPEFNFSVSRFDLGVLRRNKTGSKWYEEINVQYGLKSKNLITTPDSIFDDYSTFSQIGDYAKNGATQNLTINSNLKILGGRMTFTPSIIYNEIWNFQYQEHEWNTQQQEIDTNFVEGFGTHRNLSFNSGLASNFYGIFKFKSERNTRFKHVASPSLSFSYRPDINSYQRIEGVDTTTGLDTTFFISKYNSVSSLYTEGGRNQSGVIRFNLMNTLKMKTRNMKDTINESDNSYNLIDALSLSTSYDIFKDSMNMSNVNLSFRTAKFLKVFSFQSSAVMTPYYLDTLNRERKDYAINTGQGVGSIKSGEIAVNATFTSSSGRKKQDELNDLTENNANLNSQVTDPNKVNFEIPWKLNVSYNFKYNRQVKDSISQPDFNLIQTMAFRGDFSINKKWKIAGGINFDLQQFNQDYQDDVTNLNPYEDLVTNYNIEIWRDLHCWEAVLQFAQRGPVVKEDDGSWGSGPDAAWKRTNWVFLFRVNIKASMFQDIKLEYDRPPIFF